jgi:MFS superfamily sulfate permease-like transporter
VPFPAQPPVAAGVPGPGRAQLAADLTAGFLVSLIALPLSLGIAVASGFPPIAGVWTAIVGGLVATPLGSAPLTIKGPAAGLIVVVLGAVTELGAGDPAAGVRAALAVAFVAAGVQVLLALCRVGALADLFPTSVLQGLLAGIGVILFSRQVHVLLGVVPTARDPLGLIAEIPHSLSRAHVPVVVVTVLAAGTLLLWTRMGWRRIPAPVAVVAVTAPLAAAFGFRDAGEVVVAGVAYPVGPHLLVPLPTEWLDMVVTPDFARLLSPVAAKYVVMLALIATIESLLSARAVDALDPWRRRADLDRDLLATGVANLVSAGLGGLPMISEVVRSSANVAAGGRTRNANAFHGAFLLLFVVLLPGLLRLVPLAALAVLLVHTASRLASPGVFRAARAGGPEELAVFLTTLVTTLATDLLVGVVVGLLLNAALCVGLGAPLRSLLRPQIEVEREAGRVVVRVRDAAVFANFLAVRRAIPATPDTAVHIDLSATRVVDHTTLERLEALRTQLADVGVQVTVGGLEAHRPVSAHPRAARLRRA